MIDALDGVVGLKGALQGCGRSRRFGHADIKGSHTAFKQITSMRIGASAKVGSFA